MSTHLFSPRDAVQTRRTVREDYTVVSYRQAIPRACKAARVEPWVPGQLRHSRATDVRRDYGLEIFAAKRRREVEQERTEVKRESDAIMAREKWNQERLRNGWPEHWWGYR